MAHALDAFAAACYRVRRSALARWLFIGLAVASLGAALFARPAQLENQTVRDANIGDITISSMNTYVRVSGVLDTIGAYRTSYKLGDISLYGSRFVPLVEPSTAEAIFVLDENLPTRDPSQPVTLVAQVMMGTGAQPPMYLEIGYPPNVVLANTLARAGTVVLALVLIIALIAWAVERLDYALPLPWNVPSAQTAAAPAPTVARTAPQSPHTPPVPQGLLWFGELGRQYNDTVLRSQPAEFRATPHEARIDSAEPKGQWSVSIRRLKSAQLFEVATPYGSLPAARLRFEDERGLVRKGVIAAQSSKTRDAVLQVLSLIR